jgi:pyrroline-5-carboxylate reductase
MKIGFAGAGSIAAAIARGWAGAERGPEAMLFCDLDRGRAASLAAEVGGETRESLPELAADCDVVLLAVKPAALDDVATELEGTPPRAILSVLAATTTARLGEAFPGVPVLRVMPNQPVEMRRGVICHPPPARMPAELGAGLLELLGALGTVVALDEERMEAAMAVMSCAPAYAARFAGTLARAGEAEGLDALLSIEMVAETLAGTAELLSRHAPEAIERAVAPPGGATEAGLQALEHGGFDRAIAAAVEASLERFR